MLIQLPTVDLWLGFGSLGYGFVQVVAKWDGHPSVFNFTYTITTLQEWPEDALEAVAIKFLLQMDLDDKVRESIVLICKVISTKTE